MFLGPSNGQVATGAFGLRVAASIKEIYFFLRQGFIEVMGKMLTAIASPLIPIQAFEKNFLNFLFSFILCKTLCTV